MGSVIIQKRTVTMKFLNYKSILKKIQIDKSVSLIIYSAKKDLEPKFPLLAIASGSATATWLAF